MFSTSASVTRAESFHRRCVNTSKTGWTRDSGRDVTVVMDTACVCDVTE